MVLDEKAQSYLDARRNGQQSTIASIKRHLAVFDSANSITRDNDGTYVRQNELNKAILCYAMRGEWAVVRMKQKWKLSFHIRSGRTQGGGRGFITDSFT